MPTAPVNEHGSELYFEDTGPILGSNNYTTLFVIHGSGFNGRTFDKLLDLGSQGRTRIVTVNRRDYMGSSKYSDDELAYLEDNIANNRKFSKLTGAEIAEFLLWFIQTHKIPEIGVDTSSRSGGFLLMGWSMGVATSISVLAYPEVINADRFRCFDRYFRKLVIYDPPFTALGYPRPAEGYYPLEDPDYPPPVAVFQNFSYWVSEYYDHPDLASRNLSGLDFSKHGERATIDKISPEEMAVGFEALPMARTDSAMLTVMQPAIAEQAQNVLFSEEHATTVLPNVEVCYIWCNASPWNAIWPMFETERQQQEHLSKQHKVRPIEFIELDAANHFVHWDEPEKLWSKLSTL